MGDGAFSDKEGKLLSAGVIALIDSRLCVRDKKGNFRVRCGDGSKVTFSESEIIEVNAKILKLSGAGDWREELDSLAGDVRG